MLQEIFSAGPFTCDQHFLGDLKSTEQLFFELFYTPGQKDFRHFLYVCSVHFIFVQQNSFPPAQILKHVLYFLPTLPLKVS